MEQLKPILEHKFWILLAVALILPVAGWWMASNDLAAEISTRQSAVEKAFKDVPPSSNVPNASWAEGLNALNAERQQEISAASAGLWEAQRKYMTFPPAVQRFIDPKAFRGKIPSLGRDYYRRDYTHEIRRIRKLADPLEADGTGKVHLPEEVIPRVPEGKWDGPLIPGDVEVWDAQEDIWLLGSLMESMQRVNRNANSIVEAPIKEVAKIRLRGGSRDDINLRAKGIRPASAPAAQQASKPQRRGGGSSRREDDDTNDDLMKSLLNSGKGGQQSSSGSGFGGMAFDLNELFGSMWPNASPDFSTSEGSMMGQGDRGGSWFDSQGRDKKAESSETIVRYIDDTPDQNFVTRGFFLHLIMDHREVPELLAQLTSSQFPVEILRVHQVKYTGGGRLPSFTTDAATAAPPPTTARLTDPMNRTAVRVDPAVDIYRRAMNDPALANVAVAGIITVYRPPASDGLNAVVQAPQGGAPPAAAPGQTASVPGAPPSAPAAAAPAANGAGTAPANAAENKPAGDSPPAAGSAAPAGESSAPPSGDASAPAAESAAPPAGSDAEKSPPSDEKQPPAQESDSGSPPAEKDAKP